MRTPARSLRSMVLLLGAAFLATLSAMAAPPRLLNSQGRLTDAQGAVLSDGAHDLRFMLHDAPVGGSVVWTSPVQSADIRDGIFNVLIDLDPALPATAAPHLGAPLWLEVQVNVQGTWESFPRLALAAIPSAQAAVRADANAVDAAAIQASAIDGARMAPGAVRTSSVADGAVTTAKRRTQLGFTTVSCPGAGAAPDPDTWYSLCTATKTGPGAGSADALLLAHVRRVETSAFSGSDHVVQLYSEIEICRGTSPNCSEVLFSRRVGTSAYHSVVSEGTASLDAVVPVPIQAGANAFFLRARWRHLESDADNLEVQWPVAGLGFDLLPLGVRP